MYRRPKFLEVLLEIRQEMAREADYDADLFAELVRSETGSRAKTRYSLADEPNGIESATDAEKSKRDLTLKSGGD